MNRYVSVSEIQIQYMPLIRTVHTGIRKSSVAFINQIKNVPTLTRMIFNWNARVPLISHFPAKRVWRIVVFANRKSCAGT